VATRSRPQLEQEKAAGRSGRLSEKLLRHDLIVIDELGNLPFANPAASCCST
jgi:DNA replication protein DnaC